MAFAELAVTSNFTFLTGGSHPHEYAERAIELGLPAFAIADRNSVAGIVRAHAALLASWSAPAPGVGAAPAGGAALPGGGAGADRPAPRPRRLGAALPGAVARGAQGEEGGVPAPRMEDLAELGATCTSCCIRRPGGGCGRGCRGRGLSPRRIRRPTSSRARATTAGRRPHRALAALAGKLGRRLVASAEPIMHHGSRRRLVDVLTCIRQGSHRRDRPRRAPQRRAAAAPEAEMLRLFAAHQAAVHRAGEIAEDCRFALDELRYEYPRRSTARTRRSDSRG